MQRKGTGKEKDQEVNMEKASFRLVVLSQLGLAIIGFVCAGQYTANWQSSDGMWLLYGAIIAAACFATLYLTVRLAPFSLTKLNHDLSKYRELIGHLSYFQLIIVGLLAGISEEWFFRAFIQDLLVSFLGPTALGAGAGIVVASLAFAALHGLSKWYFVFTFFFGLSLGCVYYFSNSLLLVIVWHGVYDVIALLWLKHRNWAI